MDTATRSSRPTTVEDLHRLVALGRDRGLRLFEPQPGHWYCTSASSPMALHVVTGFSCDCAGFAHHGRCTHHALLLAHLGWLPEDPEPEPPAVRCPTCYGGGVLYDRELERIGALYPPCATCAGAGRVAVQVIAA